MFDKLLNKHPLLSALYVFVINAGGFTLLWQIKDRVYHKSPIRLLLLLLLLAAAIAARQEVRVSIEHELPLKMQNVKCYGNRDNFY
jgi:O-antigen ligase